ncbi:AAA family ATPase [Achromobacter xylosoxidans]|uniref:AAA family ATPase n=2 Tax=Alcaligenes xylosoxydans xylosoxydans TaxID=85698 RepID=UPI0009EA999B|nr:AAA family ATPase [Achromobacter xylosoxidans]
MKSSRSKRLHPFQRYRGNLCRDITPSGLMATINKLSIEGFKSISKDTLDLGQFNVFIGVNGAGKSNLLEALAMLSSAIEGHVDYESLQRRGARLSSSAIFRSAFRNKERRNAFKIAAQMAESYYAVSVNAIDGFRYLAESLARGSKRLAGRSNKGATINKRSIPNKLDNKKGIFPLLRASLDLGENGGEDFRKSVDAFSKLARFSIYAPATPLLRGVEPDRSAREPLGLYGGNLADALEDVIKDKDSDADIRRFFKMMEWVRSFGVTTETDPELVSGQLNLSGAKVRYTDKFMKTSFNSLYAYDVSEGALYVLFILVLLIHRESPDIFALDNVDNALNPGLCRRLMIQMADVLREHPEKQVFVTTHNPTALDGIDLFDPTHRLFVIERDEFGHTKSRRVAPPAGMTRDQWALQYGGLPLSEVWLSGAIGGLPVGY